MFSFIAVPFITLPALQRPNPSAAIKVSGRQSIVGLRVLRGGRLLIVGSAEPEVGTGMTLCVGRSIAASHRLTRARKIVKWYSLKSSSGHR